MSEQYAISEASQAQVSERPPKSMTRPASATTMKKYSAAPPRPGSAKVKAMGLLPQELDKTKTHAFFKETKVGACAHVIVKDGVPLAVPFYKTPKKTAAEKMTKMGIGQSFSQLNLISIIHREQFKQHADFTIGSRKKPLMPYNPDAQRNRMPQPVMRQPATNFSQIQFGDGNPVQAVVKRQFKSTSKNAIGNHPQFGFISNPAILSAKTGMHKTSVQK